MRVATFSVALVCVLCCSMRARADSLGFDFSALDQTGAGGSCFGNGTFSFDGSASTLGLASLTAFWFAQTVQLPGSRTSIFSYSLGDLTAFSANVEAGLLTSLTLNLRATRGSNGTFFAESFHVDSIARNGASATNSFGALLQLGSVQQIDPPSQPSAGVMPEPASFVSLGTGMLALMGLARRRLRQGLLVAAGVARISR